MYAVPGADVCLGSSGLSDQGTSGFLSGNEETVND